MFTDDLTMTPPPSEQELQVLRDLSARTAKAHGGASAFEQSGGLFDLALHMLAKHCHAFGVAQITVIQQPQPQFMLLFRFAKSCQLGVAVAQKARQKTNTQPFFHCRKC